MIVVVAVAVSDDDSANNNSPSPSPNAQPISPKTTGASASSEESVPSTDEQASVDVDLSAQRMNLERSSLMDFFKATGGPSWDDNYGWGSQTLPVCQWKGVRCDGNGFVRRL